MKHDCGFNNFLSIRGFGTKGRGEESSLAELNWNKGIALKNTAPGEWIFECDIPDIPCEFKILLNDELYEYGENHILASQDFNQITPHF